MIESAIAPPKKNTTAKVMSAIWFWRSRRAMASPDASAGEPLEIDAAMIARDPDRHYLGPIKLGVNVRRMNVLAICYTGLASVWMTNFFSIMQPLVLTDNLHLAKDMLGRVGGQLALSLNAAVLICTVLFGAISDRVRPNRFLVFAYLGLALAGFLYPLGHSLSYLMGGMFLLGAAQTITLTAGAAHGMQYVDNNSRGSYGSMMSLVNIGGVTLVAAQFGAKLPTILQHHGLSHPLSLRYSYWVFAALVAPAALVARYFLVQDPPVHRDGPIDFKAEAISIGTNFRAVLRYARTNPRFQLVLLSSLFMRGDFAVVSTFLSTWVTTVGRGRGIEVAASVKHAGQMYSVTLMCLMASMFVVGLLLDRINRIVLLITALGIVSVAYLTPMFVRDVFGISGMICAGAIGIAEGTIVITLGALLAQEAPPHLRGISVGVYNLIAIIGVGIVNYFGGILFDRVGHTAPFVMMAVFNMLTLVRAIPFYKHRHGVTDHTLVAEA